MVAHTSKLVDFTEDGSKFAHSCSGILRLWDVASSTFLHEYTPANHLTATTTCIKFSPLSKKKGKKRKKRESVDSEDRSRKLLALGTVSGTVIVYDYEEHEMLCQLKHSSSSAINDLWWNSSHNLFTLGRDNKVIQWDVNKQEAIKTMAVGVGESLCLIGGKKMVIGSTGLQIRDLNNPDAPVSNLTGHTSPTIQLLPVIEEGDSIAKYFLSAAADDKFLYAWSRDSPTQDPVCSLLVKDTVYSFTTSNSTNGDVTVSVATNKGFLRVFSHHLNGNHDASVFSSKCQLKITTHVNKQSRIPIIASYVVDSNTVDIVYGTSVVLKFERVDISTMTGEVFLLRSTVESFIKKTDSLLKTITPKITRDTTHLRPGYQNTTQNTSTVKRKHGDSDGEKQLPMEERVNTMVADGRFSLATAPPLTDNCSQLLMQGLHSKDDTLISSVLSQGKDDKLVNNTVRRLPIQMIVPFINHLTSYTRNKGHKEFSYLTWVKALLYHHSGHLSTLHNRQALLEPFYAEASSMIDTQHKFKQLQARLDLILTQVEERKAEPCPIIDPVALLVYQEESADEGNLDVGLKFGGGASESDDNWDELSDIVGHSEESEMETDNVKLKSIENSINKDDSITNDNDSSSDDEPGVNGLIICSDDEEVMCSDDEDDNDVIVL